MDNLVLEVPVAHTTKTIRVQNSTIYYTTAGEKGMPTLLFLHGWPGTKLHASGLLGELANYFYVIAPEHPGLLRSEPLKTYSNIFNQYAEVAHAVLLAEAPPDIKVIIWGQSFGGGVASAFACQYPQATNVLVLSDSALGAGKQDVIRIFLRRYGITIMKKAVSVPRIVQEWIMRYGFGMKLLSHEDAKASLTARIPMTYNMLSLYKESLHTGISLIDRLYGNFRIVMVWGEKDGKEFNVAGYCCIDDAKKLYEKMKREGRDIIFIQLRGGHTIVYDNPAYVVREVLPYLI